MEMSVSLTTMVRMVVSLFGCCHLCVCVCVCACVCVRVCVCAGTPMVKDCPW